MLMMVAAFAVVFGPHGKPVQATLNLLHAILSTMSMELRIIVLFAQVSQETLYKHATQPPITLLALLALIF